MSGRLRAVTAADLGNPLHGLDEAVYHLGLVDGEPSLSHSGMKSLLSKTLWHFRHDVDHPEDRQHKNEYDLGSALHAAVLGVGKVVVIRTVEGEPAQTWGSQKIRDQRDMVSRRGDIPVTGPQYELMAAMAKSLRQNPKAAELLDRDSGHPEVSLFARDPETGVILRCRIDWWRNDGRMVDLKSAGRVGGAAPATFGRHGYDYGYYLQVAVYTYVAELCGIEVPGFDFVVQETTAPYAASVTHFGPSSIELGRQHMRRAIDLYAEAMTSGVWPGYPAESVEIDVPRWALTEAGIQTNSTSSELSGDSTTDVSGLLDDLERILAE